MTNQITKEAVLKALSTVQEPDLHQDLVTLNMVHNLEIEGNSVDRIQEMAARVQLNWDAAISRSYSALFETVKKALKLKFDDLSFENFAGMEVKPEHLGVIPADLPGYA